MFASCWNRFPIHLFINNLFISAVIQVQRSPFSLWLSY